MSMIKVYADTGELIDTLRVDDVAPADRTGRDLTGHDEPVQGTLGRALADARLAGLGKWYADPVRAIAFIERRYGGRDAGRRR